MGQANNRGTFKTRKKQAIMHGRIKIYDMFQELTKKGNKIILKFVNSLIKLCNYL